MVLVLIVVVVVLVVVLQLLKLGGQSVAVLHGGNKLLAGEPVPGRGYHHCAGIELLEHGSGGKELLLRNVPGAAQNDNVGVFDLIVEEFTEVADIHFALVGVHHCYLGANIGLAGHCRHRRRHVGQLAHAGGLDNNAVGGVVLNDLFKGGLEIAHQSAADAPGVHLGYLNAGILQKAAVYGYFAELIFDEYDLLPGVGLFDELAYERGFSRAQKA